MVPAAQSLAPNFDGANHGARTAMLTCKARQTSVQRHWQHAPAARPASRGGRRGPPGADSAGGGARPAQQQKESCAAGIIIIVF
eukprot:6797701-Pyramimonas_sp.AAC.1